MPSLITKALPTLLFGGACAAVHAQTAQPNIIFVLVDDLGYGDVGVLYQNARRDQKDPRLPSMRTPNIDKLANDGIRLDRHYCPAPVCAPSRASLISGVHQGHANIRDNQFDKAIEDNHTLATVLQGGGYATACIGKWGLGGQWGKTKDISKFTSPTKHGFDYFFGWMEHGKGHYHYPYEVLNGTCGGKDATTGIFESTPEGGLKDIVQDMAKCYSTDVITARAKKWIVDERKASPHKPFFLYLAYIAPHARLDVPTMAYPSGGGLSGGLQWSGKSGALINTAQGTVNAWIHPDYNKATYTDTTGKTVAWPAYAKRFATMVRRVDDSLADLRQLLRDLNIDRNTVIVFSSDNGPHDEIGNGGAYVENPQFFRAYGPFDGIKCDVLEGGARVPTFVVWPGKIKPGSMTTHPSQFHDWMNTFAEIAGVPQPERSDGVSLVPTLTGKPDLQRESTIYTEYSTGVLKKTPGYKDFLSDHQGRTRGHEQMLYIGKYKGVRYNVGAPSDAFAVYDTLADPQESTNLAGQAGVPSQADFEARVLHLRRPGGGVVRPYDATPVPPVEVNNPAPGLSYRIYQKKTSWVPNWEIETASSAGKTATPSVDGIVAPVDSGALFKGYIRIPADGSYAFTLTTDTGAFVRLHDAQLIDADYGYAAGSEVSSGKITLKAGYHPISIYYRHGSGASRALSLKWSGPGIDKQEIPATAFFQGDAGDPSSGA